MLEKAIAEMLKEIPMPRRVKFANTFLRMPDFDKPQIIQIVDRGINSLGCELEQLTEAHDLTNYEEAKERLKQNHTSREYDGAIILPKNRIYITSEELFSLLPEFRLYLQQCKEYEKSQRSYSGLKDHPRGIDRCLVKCLSAVNKVGFLPFLSETRRNMFVPVKIRKTFFWHEQKTSNIRFDEEDRRIPEKDSHYPYLREYCEELNATLGSLEKQGYNIEKERRKIPITYRE